MDSIAGLPADGCSKEASKEEDQVELTRAEMSQVREENSRLKKLLEKIENDYNSLQMRFVGVSQPSEPAVETKNCSDSDHKDAPSGNEPPPELVSLSLGRSSLIQPKKHSRDDSGGPSGAKEELHQRYHHLKKEGDLRLALDFNPVEDCKSDPVEVQTPDPSPESSQLETKDEEGRETWPPGKVSKATTKSGGDDDLSQTGAKRARVSVRTRCDTPTMNDGCQWRKYGQKIAKGNPCPRAYYRCTVAPSCPVRKQVQRCAQDTSILITTYEGMHNHPLPFSATAMASTTSAAASMLLSGSSSTSQFASASNTSLCSPLIGLNVNLSENSRSRPFYLPNSSPASYPTITLDLTSEPSTTSNQFNVFSSGGFQSFPRTSSTSLSFAPSQPGMLSSIWANGNLNSGANGMPYSKNHMMMGSLQSGKTFQEHLHQAPFLQKNFQAAAPSQQALTETLTKAITSDPNLRSVIAAAITTMVGGGANGTQVSDDRLQGLGKRLKWDDHQRAAAINSSSPAAGTNGKGCASSFLNQSSFSTPLSVSLGEQQPQQPFSITKSAASATASENADQTN